MKRLISAFSLMIMISVSAPAATSYKGDFNADGKVNMADYALLAKGVVDGNSNAAFDLDLSGKPDIADLHILANLIINEELIEDNGLNIGIGGWDDSGEDWGGAVYAPSRRGVTRASYDISSDLSNLYYDFDSKQAKADLILNGADSPSAILVNFEMPKGALRENDYISLCESSLCTDATIMGIPKILPLDDRYCLRFIVASPSMNRLRKGDNRNLVTLNLSEKDEFYNVAIGNCMAVMAGDNQPFETSKRNFYDIYWKFIPVSSISFENDLIECSPGDVIYIYPRILPENATNKMVEFSSSNEFVASIEEWDIPIVTINNLGRAIITAKALDGSNVSASYVIDTTTSIGMNPEETGPYILYDIFGRPVATFASSDDISSLPPGIYIISHTGKTTKIVVR